jgi:hypothetical protein
MKKLLQSKFVKNIIAPIVRGTLKTIPGGSVAVELVQNFQNKTEGKRPKHHWLSITIQTIGIAAIIWAFYTKAITVEQLLQLLQGFAPTE